MLQLRVMDVRNKSQFKIITQKSGNEVTIPLNATVQFEIKKYIEDKSESEFLFKSREGENRPITSVQADRVLKAAATACGVENWGTHSMRKPFGYHFHHLNHDVYYLMKLFGHSSQSKTLEYIGITNDEIRKSMEGLTL